MKKYYYLLFTVLLMAVLPIGLISCGDDDDEPDSKTNSRIQVDGKRWDLSNALPPVFNATHNNEGGLDLIFTHFRKKLTPDKWEEYFDTDRAGEMYDIYFSISGYGMEPGINLLDDPKTWHIVVSYSHNDTNYDNPPADCFNVEYHYWNPSRFGQTNSGAAYSGSIVIKEYVKGKSMTIEYKDFCLTGYSTDGSWEYNLSDHKSITLNGTVTYEFDEVTW